MKSVFCDDCIKKILQISDDVLVNEAVIYDAADNQIYPISEGTIHIGDYELQTTFDSGDYKIKIEYETPDLYD